MRRRDFLVAGITTLVAGPRILLASVRQELPALNFYHTHTGEDFSLRVSVEEGIPQQDLAAANYFLRDFRTEQVTDIDPGLFAQLHELRIRLANHDGAFEIISAYRSPKTNDMLRGKSTAVARKSHHVQGRALDIRLRGTPTSDLRDAALAMKSGGVGYYRRSDFVHLDTGRVRAW